MGEYHVVLKSHDDQDFKEYVTREMTDKQEATLIKDVLKNQIDKSKYIVFEKE